MSAHRLGLAVLLLHALLPGPASAVLHQGTKSSTATVEAVAAEAEAASAAQVQAEDQLAAEDLEPPAAEGLFQKTDEASLHEDTEGARAKAKARTLDPQARRELEAWKRRRAAEIAASRSEERTLSAAEVRERQRAERMAKWEVLERRREAERRMARAAKKLSEAKKAKQARLAETKQQEKDRAQRAAREKAARQKEQEEQEREAAVPEGGIRVNVIDGKNYGVRITVPKEGVRAHVLMATAAQRMGLEAKKVVFVHNGVELKEHEPIEKYNLEDLDTVDVRRKWW